MKVHFKGTRGSIPTAYSSTEINKKIVGALLAARGKDLRSEGQIKEFVDKKLPFHLGYGWGGNTPCVHVETGSEDFLIFDGGSGIRPLGQEIAKSGVKNSTFHIFISHLHYDHIQGIPFFVPAYDSSNKIVFHGGHKHLEKSLKGQMKTPFFPIDMDTFNADVSFEIHKPGETIDLCNSQITIIEQDHPGISYGYRVDSEGKSVVYSTDAEHSNLAHSKEYPFINFIKGSDLLIFDAPYTHSQSIGNREHWGHSSNIMGVELAARGEVGTLAIFHHDPGSSDQDLDEFQAHTKKFLQSSRTAIKQTQPGIPGAPSSRKFPTEIISAYDGLSIAL
ncbi:MAG: MBL fold metallo-hydrolase [Opitutales bacterium]|nr:MBL fold metallo-hydrolase [Opitutales bacterium]